MDKIIISIFEILAVGFTVWCLFNEDKLVKLEKKIKEKFKK